MRIAIVGAGVSGLVCAYLLAAAHDVTLFEKQTRLGGHTNTVEVRREGRSIHVDTGFIVFNERNYPNFSRLIDRLGVSSQPTTMSFSVRDESTGFEYGGASLAGVVGPVSNLLRPRWWRVVRGVMRLGRDGKRLLANAGETTTIRDLYESGAFSRGLLDDYLVPMASAIWSAPQSTLMEFPARFLLRFFDNHGMLDLRERPQWRTISGGSSAYIDAMREVIDSCARTQSGVTRIARSPGGVEITSISGVDTFDHVILACHSDEALAAIADASEDEMAILGAMPYQENDTLLHTDASLLPKRKRCWAGWNYRLADDPNRPVAVTYNMSILQRLETTSPLCVTLNDAEVVDPSKVIDRYTYHHPVYTLEGDRARTRWGEISNLDRRTHFCGAYWGNGFHEDGVVSALRVCEEFGAKL